MVTAQSGDPVKLMCLRNSPGLTHAFDIIGISLAGQWASTVDTRMLSVTKLPVRIVLSPFL
jgi:hypothetical protein